MLSLARRHVLSNTGAPLCQRRALMSAFSQAAAQPAPPPPPASPATAAARPRRDGAPFDLPVSNQDLRQGAAAPTDPTPLAIPEASTSTAPASTSNQPSSAAQPTPRTKTRPQLRATKAAITVTPHAVERLRTLLDAPDPKLIRIGVRNKGCAGLSYHLEYVDRPGKFDEVVEPEEGVKVLIDSKALFSIIGSEMDWVEGRLSSKFAFKNPNIKDACGCGESFTV